MKRFRALLRGVVRPSSILALVLLGLALGYFMFQGLWGRPRVGVIRISYAELYSTTAQDIAYLLNYAKDRRDIKAVVVSFTSPGGGAADSEALFTTILHVREEKPVVVSIDSMAASGGYMMAVAADYIYAKAISFVGNVGAIMWIPTKPEPPYEELVSTGPFKLTGGSRRTYTSMLEMVKDAFVRVVASQRGERLRISQEELAQGRLYIGLEAVRLGLVDELGTEEDAIRKAAQLAGIRNYQIVDIKKKVEGEEERFFWFSPAAPSRPSLPHSYYRIDYLFVERD